MLKYKQRVSEKYFLLNIDFVNKINSQKVIILSGVLFAMKKHTDAMIYGLYS